MQFDSAGAGNGNPVSSLAFPHVVANVTGRVMHIAIWTEQTADLLTAVDFNGDAATRIGTVTQGTQRIYKYRLVAPDVGTFNVNLTFSSPVNVHAVSTVHNDGAKQTLQPAAITVGQASGATLTLPVDVKRSDSWLISCAANEANGITAGAGTTNRTGGTGVIRMGDSNGPVNRGTKQMVWTPGNSGQESVGIITYIRPTVSADGAMLVPFV